MLFSFFGRSRLLIWFTWVIDDGRVVSATVTSTSIFQNVGCLQREAILEDVEIAQLQWGNTYVQFRNIFGAGSFCSVMDQDRAADAESGLGAPDLGGSLFAAHNFLERQTASGWFALQQVSGDVHANAFKVIAEDCFSSCLFFHERSSPNLSFLSVSELVQSFAVPRMSHCFRRLVLADFVAPVHSANRIVNAAFQNEPNHMQLLNLNVFSISFHSGMHGEFDGLFHMYLSDFFKVHMDAHSLDVDRCKDAACQVSVSSLSLIRAIQQTLSPVEGLLGQGYPNLKQWQRPLQEYLQDSGVQLAICLHPPALCWLLFGAAMSGISVVGQFAGRLDHMVPLADRGDWVRDFVAMSTLSNVLFTCVSNLLALITWFQSSAKLPVVHFFGLSIGLKHDEGRADILVWKSSVHCCGADHATRTPTGVFSESENLQRMLQLLLGASRAPFKFEFLRDLRRLGLAHYDQLFSYSALLLFPYEINLLTFFEFYHAGMPMFLPSVDLLPIFMFRGPVTLQSHTIHYDSDQLLNSKNELESRMSNQNCSFPEMDALFWDVVRIQQIPEARIWWAQLAEYQIWPGIIYFSSLHDLIGRVTLAKNSGSAGLWSSKEQMIKFSANVLQEKTTFWRHRIRSLVV